MRRKKIIVVYIVMVLFLGAMMIPTSYSIKTNERSNEKNKSIVYVNNEWNDQADVDIFNIIHGLHLVWNYNATNDIQDGVNLVEENGCVKILAGAEDYSIGSETITIKKSLRLEGENKRFVTIDGNGYASVIGVKGDKVRICNLTIHNGKNEYRYAGILVYEQAKELEICNCILRNNGHGIYTNVNADIKDLSIKIFDNEIRDNRYDGILIRSKCEIFNNQIFYNDNDGIEINTESSSQIYNNTIKFNMADGIWIDALPENEEHKIYENNLSYNRGCGIHLGDWWNRKDLIEECEIFDNDIFNNTHGGILIHRSKDNKFYDNSIMNNKEFGFKIIYFFYQKKLWEDRQQFPIMGPPFSENNEIFHNNFIQNGKDGKVNAIDSHINSKNKWDFNYWSDSEHIDDDGDAMEDSKYKIRAEIFGLLTPQFIGFISDDHPFCRINCWDPTAPEIPELIPPESTVTYLDNSLTFKARSTDENLDKIGYQWCWGDGEYTIDDNDGTYYESGEVSQVQHSWENPGDFAVCVKAFDVYENKYRDEDDDIDIRYEPHIDGESDWSSPVVIEVIE